MNDFGGPIDQKLQNRINKSYIFNYIKKNQPVSRAKIAKKLKISPSAVSRVVGILIKDRFIIETKKGESKIGKKPILLNINPEKGCVVALDLSKDKLIIAIHDFNDNVIIQYTTFQIEDKRSIIKKVIKEIKRVCHSSDPKSGFYYKDIEVKAISLGIPADIDIETGRIVSGSLYKNWHDINFKQLLEEEFNLPVYVEKDVLLSTIAEKQYGYGKEFDNLVFLEISIGVSSGIIINNKLLRGQNSSAGQIAFMTFNNEKNKNINTKGFLDNNASYKSIKDRAIELASKNKNTILNELANNRFDQLDTTDVFEAALKNDSISLSILEDVSNLLSKTISHLVLILDPQIIVIGGNISKCIGVEELFLNKISSKVKKLIPFEIPIFKISMLKENAVIIGASLFAINSIISKKFPYHLNK